MWLKWTKHCHSRSWIKSVIFVYYIIWLLLVWGQSWSGSDVNECWWRMTFFLIPCNTSRLSVYIDEVLLRPHHYLTNRGYDTCFCTNVYCPSHAVGDWRHVGSAVEGAVNCRYCCYAPLETNGWQRLKECQYEAQIAEKNRRGCWRGSDHNSRPVRIQNFKMSIWMQSLLLLLVHVVSKSFVNAKSTA